MQNITLISHGKLNIFLQKGEKKFGHLKKSILNYVILVAIQYNLFSSDRKICLMKSSSCYK